ncbi:hypothetical protein H8959_003833 [Pygathrix nigripes]
MWPLKPGAPLSALLLLALALSPPGAHGRPRGPRGAYLTGEEPKPLLFLPAAGAGRTPSGSRSAGTMSPSRPILCPAPGAPWIPLGAGRGTRFGKLEISTAENRASLQIPSPQKEVIILEGPKTQTAAPKSTLDKSDSCYFDAQGEWKE